jgi:nitric oxide dioxygenase
VNLFNEDGKTKLAPRHYTITSPTGENFFQISTKRLEHGVVSSYMHDTLVIGDTVQLAPPFGPFNADKTKTAVLISAGIGMTTMKAFQQSLGSQVVQVVHFDKDSAHVPFKEFFEKTNKDKNMFYYTNDARGRPSMTAVVEELSKKVGLTHKFYICGPPTFMHEVAHGLLKAGVPKDMIAWESFTPQLSCPV